MGSRGAGHTPLELARRALSGAYVTILDVLRRPSLCLATGALLGTYLSKIWWYIAQLDRPAGMKMSFAAFMAADLLFWAAVIAVVLAAETYVRRRWVRFATTALTALLTLVAILNVFWLRGTGGQLRASVLEVGVTRTAEVLPIIESGLGPLGIALMLLAVALPILLPLLFRAKWRLDGRGEAPRLATFGFPAFLLLAALVGFVEQQQRPDAPGWRLIASNVHYSLVKELATEPALGPPPAALPDPAPPTAGARPASAELPHVVVVILEATARRATSLDPTAPPATPFLKQLAAQGLEATQMRAVLPHTTKSLFSILCGQYPAMQHHTYETADNFPMRCLPAILGEHGYATAFVQSADGRFEDRPRLVRNMGFAEFKAWQDIEPRAQALSYLASDDMSLVEPAVAWIAAQSGPGFLTVLTSATHHDYEMPTWLTQKVGFDNSESRTKRYLALVRAADEMLFRLVSRLGQLETGRDLVVIAFGDHGEGFGEHGKWQHDNVYFEEGLHVPFVLYAPGRIAPGTRDVQTRSLLDVTPTVLDLARVPYIEDRLAGRSLTRPDAPPVRRYFSCWYNNACVGFVEGARKLVLLPGDESWLTFDLAADPGEWQPSIEAAGLEQSRAEVARWYAAHRYTKRGLTWQAPLDRFEGWECGGGPTSCVSRRADKE